VLLALRWMTLQQVSGVGDVRHWFYFAAKALRVGPIVSVLEAPGHGS
jgi:hypothetical protein